MIFSPLTGDFPTPTPGSGDSNVYDSFGSPIFKASSENERYSKISTQSSPTPKQGQILARPSILSFRELGRISPPAISPRTRHPVTQRNSLTDINADSAPGQTFGEDHSGRSKESRAESMRFSLGVESTSKENRSPLQNLSQATDSFLDDSEMAHL